MRVGIVSDIHLDHIKRFAGPKGWRIGQEIARGLDALVISGDIATVPTFKETFTAFLHEIDVPVYFVLGNHDYWGGPSSTLLEVAESFDKATFLDTAGVVELTPDACLVGRTGWYDARTGNPYSSTIRLNDWAYIPRMNGTVWLQDLLINKCEEWADEETAKAKPVLLEAAAKYKHVYFATHFPLFREACWGENGEPTTYESGWFPWSVNTVMGHLLRQVAVDHPSVQFTATTGHTHGNGHIKMTPNLEVFSSQATYGEPKLARIWDIG